MDTLKDIFVSYEIAEKLKEIGFDTKCLAYYYNDKDLNLFEEDFKITTDEEYNNFVIAPSYEQVFKWFRERGYFNDFVLNDYFKKYNIAIKYKDEFKSYLGYDTYEEAREQLILKFIEIYKNGCKR